MRQAKTLKDAEIKRVLAYCATRQHALRDTTIFVFSLHAGLRAKELNVCLHTAQHANTHSVTQPSSCLVYTLDYVQRNLQHYASAMCMMTLATCTVRLCCQQQQQKGLAHALYTSTKRSNANLPNITQHYPNNPQRHCSAVKKAVSLVQTQCANCSYTSSNSAALNTQLHTAADARLLHAWQAKALECVCLQNLLGTAALLQRNAILT